jgi:hypothetical protein
MPRSAGASVQYLYTAREEDAERETEAMLCMLGRLAVAEDPDIAVRVIREDVRDEAWVGME